MKYYIFFILLLFSFSFVHSATPLVNVVSIDGISNFDDIYFSYSKDSSLQVLFNVLDLDNDDLDILVILEYGDENLEVETNYNLRDEGICVSNNFSSLTSCIYDLNIYSIDSNEYSLYIGVTDGGSTQYAKSDIFNIDNTNPSAIVNFTNSWRDKTLSLIINCFDLHSGCANIFYRIDSLRGIDNDLSSKSFIPAFLSSNSSFYSILIDSLIDLNSFSKSNIDTFFEGLTIDKNSDNLYGTGSINKIFSFDKNYTDIKAYPYLSSIDDEDLSLWFNFNDNLTDLKNDFTLTKVRGTQSFVDSKNNYLNKSLYIDGSTSYSLTQSQESILDSDYTISLWVNVSDYQNSNGFNHILDKFTGGSPGAGYLIAYNTNNNRFLFIHRAQTEAMQIYSTSTYGYDEWNHIVATTNTSTKTSYLYVNGVLQGSDTYLGNLINLNNDLFIGSNRAPYDRNFKGYIDDIKIYKRFMTLDDVNYLYSQGISSLDVYFRSCNDDLCSSDSNYLSYLDYNYFPQKYELRNDTLNLQVYDDLTNNNVINNNGGDIFGELNFNDYANFDGNSYIEYNANVKELNNATWIFGIKTDTNVNPVASRGIHVNENGWNIYLDSLGKLNVEVYELANMSSNKYRHFLFDKVLSDNNYYDVAIVFNNGDLNAYANYELIDKTIVVNNSISKIRATPNQPLKIGRVKNSIMDKNYVGGIKYFYMFEQSLGELDINNHIDNLSQLNYDYFDVLVELNTENPNYTPYLDRIDFNVSFGFGDSELSIDISDYLDAEVDGNFSLEYYVTDVSNNAYENEIFDVIISRPFGIVETYDLDFNNARTFFGDESVFIYLKNDVNYYYPKISVLDSFGNVYVQDEYMQYYDENNYYYILDLNQDFEIGFYDLNINGRLLEDIFYKSNIWVSNSEDFESNMFPFQIDFNVLNSSDFNRFKEYVEFDFNFDYRAKEESLKLLEYYNGNYLEIPYVIVDKNIQSSLIKSAKIGFLSTINSDTNKTYYLSYSNNNIYRSYSNDFDLVIEGNLIEILNSDYSLSIDLSRGGIINDLNYNYFDLVNLSFDNKSMLSPYVRKNDETIYYVSNVLASSQILYDSNIKKEILITGENSGFNYNILYSFYAQNPHFKMDLNIIPKATEFWTEYFDSYFRFNPSIFTNAILNKNNDYYFNNLELNEDSLDDNLYVTNVSSFAIYDEHNKSGFSTYFTSIKPGVNTSFDFRDDLINEEFKRRTNMGSVNTSTIYKSVNYYSFFNANNALFDFNKLNNTINNSLTYQIGSTSSFDSTNPLIEDLDINPDIVYDSNYVYCVAQISDDVEIDYINVRIIGDGTSIDENIVVNDDFYDLNYAFLSYSGDNECIVEAYDISNNSDINSISFFALDYSEPKIISIITNPDTNEEIDPNTLVLIDVNLFEYSGLAYANIFYRFEDDDWNVSEFTCSQDGYFYDCNFELYLDYEGIYEYKIYTSDINGFDLNSSSYFLYSYYERDWNSYSSFDTNIVSNGFDTNIDLGFIRINNNGDVNLEFKIISNWDDKLSIYFNDTEESVSGIDIEIEPLDYIDLFVKIKTKTTQREDDVNISVIPITTGTDNDTKNYTAKIVSSSSTSYLFIEFLESDLLVSRSDTNIFYNSKITNIGSVTCSNVSTSWVLPNGFTESVSNIFNGTLNSLSSSFVSINLDIIGSASTGSNSLCLNAVCVDNSEEFTKCLDVFVSSSSSGGNSSSGGGGGGGGSSQIITQNVIVERDLPQFDVSSRDIFVKNNKFEVIRGDNSKYFISLENPFLDVSIENVNLLIDGLHSRNISINPNNIKLILPNEKVLVEVFIDNVLYLDSGSNLVNLIVEGNLKSKDNLVSNFKEIREIDIFVLDYSESLAKQYLDDMNKMILELESLGFYVGRLNPLLIQANTYFNLKRFDLIIGIRDTILNNYNSANNYVFEYKKLDELVNLSEFSLTQTRKLLISSNNAFLRGDFKNANSLLLEAQNVYLLESKNEFNLFDFIWNNLPIILLSTILLSLLSVSLYFIVYRNILINRIEVLNKEKTLTLHLISSNQKAAFIDKKMSMNDYNKSLNYLNEKLNGIVSKILTYKNRLRYMLNRSHALELEKQDLLEEMKKIQKAYFGLKNYQSRFYDINIKSLIDRVTEIESVQAELEYKKKLPFFKRWF